MTIYEPGARATCPHCQTIVLFEEADRRRVGRVQGDILDITAVRCPHCAKITVTIERGHESAGRFTSDQEHVVWPLRAARPVPSEVPTEIAADYEEAVIVLGLSPKASAALSRRCLQAVLREAGNATQQNLSKQIDAVRPDLPAYVAESVDYIRNIGNFAAHPTKDKSSGQIVDVEPGEAEWNLDVLDMLFDHYYVKPLQARKKRDALDAKLKAAGKPPMK